MLIKSSVSGPVKSVPAVPTAKALALIEHVLVPVVPVYGTSTLSSDFTLSSSAGTFVDTGLSVTLPSAGVYLIFANVRAQISFSLGTEAFVQIRFYNSTDAVYIDDGRIGAYTNKAGSDQLEIHTIPMQTVVYVNGSKTIKLYAARMSASTFLESSISSNSEGKTIIGYAKLSN